MFFVIGLPFCFVLPCFATGCHAFGFKIAASGARALLAMTNLIELLRLYHGLARTETR